MPQIGQQIDVVRVVVTCNDEVLILNRAVGDEFRGGDGDIPGGRVELGEDPHVAGARELWEESGIKVDPNELRPVPGFEAVPDRRHGKLLFKTVLQIALSERPERIVTDPKEHSGGGFYSREEARKRFWHTLYSPAIEEVFKEMQVGVATGTA